MKTTLLLIVAALALTAVCIELTRRPRTREVRIFALWDGEKVKTWVEDKGTLTELGRVEIKGPYTYPVGGVWDFRVVVGESSGNPLFKSGSRGIYENK